MKLIIIVISLAFLILGGGVWLLTKGSVPSAPESEIIARNGIHWHPKLHLYLHGEPIILEDNIGRKGVEQPIHTHAEDYQDGVIHLEFPGVVAKNQTRLANFFKIWGKDFNWGTEQMIMTVNGQTNTDLANYPMKDGDLIEIRYE